MVRVWGQCILEGGSSLSIYFLSLCWGAHHINQKRRGNRRSYLWYQSVFGCPNPYKLTFCWWLFPYFGTNERESQLTQEILTAYEKGSGQAINMQKSEIFFSKKQEDREQVSKSVWVHENIEAYLLWWEERKRLSSTNLHDRVWIKIQSWSDKHLSKAGREVLIKSVVQAIPTYVWVPFSFWLH